MKPYALTISLIIAPALASAEGARCDRWPDIAMWGSALVWNRIDAKDFAGCAQMDVNNFERNKEGETILHNASVIASADVIAALIKVGADPNARDKHGYTPLHTASRYGNTGAIAVLLRAGADINAKTSLQELEQTPLHLATRRSNAETVLLLLKAGANLNARNFFGETPLHIANELTVVTLIKAGADLNSRDLDGNTPLHSAAQFGSPEVVVALIKAGADGSLKDASGKTAFEDINENSKVKGTEAYWMLNDAQFN